MTELLLLALVAALALVPVAAIVVFMLRLTGTLSIQLTLGRTDELQEARNEAHKYARLWEDERNRHVPS